ncbi:MAG: ADP-ribosylglycohydrolase family protein, partial [Fibrobacteres bacterium]|nr:ADP-ribosylglycohydrolase family protein [Fibrobacterota bacterium]
MKEPCLSCNKKFGEKNTKIIHRGCGGHLVYSSFLHGAGGHKYKTVYNNALFRISDLVKGVFYGQAIGDALGLGTEFMSKEEVKEHYPKGYHHYVQILQDTFRSKWRKGDWTDDTDQFLCIIYSVLEKQKVDDTIFAKHLLKWYMEDPIDV